MPAKRLSLVMAGLALLVVSLVASAPARLLPRLLPADQILVQGLEGSLWRGSASRALVAAGPGYVHLGSLKWRLSPLSLLLLAPSLEVDSSWGDQRLSGRVTLRDSDSFSLEAVEATASADLVRQFAPVALTGLVSAQVEHLVLREMFPVSGRGRLVWQDAAWQSPQGRLRLGAYALDFEQLPDAPMLAQVVSLAGPVRAEGELRLEGRSYSSDLLISGDEALDPQFEQALSLLARPEGEGFRLQLKGAL